MITAEDSDSSYLAQFFQISVESWRIHRVNDPDTVLSANSVARSFSFLPRMGEPAKAVVPAIDYLNISSGGSMISGHIRAVSISMYLMLLI